MLKCDIDINSFIFVLFFQIKLYLFIFSEGRLQYFQVCCNKGFVHSNNLFLFF